MPELIHHTADWSVSQLAEIRTAINQAIATLRTPVLCPACAGKIHYDVARPIKGAETPTASARCTRCNRSHPAVIL